METPKPRNQLLWDHMVNEYDLHLLDSEMYEIELVVARMLADDCANEPALRSSSELGAVSGYADTWIAARVRMWRLYRYAYRMSIAGAAWRSLYTWFLWDVYDRVRFKLRNPHTDQAQRPPGERI